MGSLVQAPVPRDSCLPLKAGTRHLSLQRFPHAISPSQLTIDQWNMQSKQGRENLGQDPTHTLQLRQQAHRGGWKGKNSQSPPTQDKEARGGKVCPLYGFPGGAEVKNLPGMQETWEMQVQSMAQEDALEEEMATHSSVLAWRIPGMGEPGGLPSMGSHRVGHD